MNALPHIMGSSRFLVGFRKDSLRRCAPAPSEREPFGGETVLCLPLRGRWLGGAETEGVDIPQVSVKSHIMAEASARP